MKPKKILVVDDEPLNCEMLQELLQDEGYQVAVAFSGDEALEATEMEMPDLVLLDIRMPGKGGLDTLRELKALHPDLAAIVLTGLHDRALAEQAKAEGAAGFITKPIQPDRLLGLIGKLAPLDEVQ